MDTANYILSQFSEEEHEQVQNPTHLSSFVERKIKRSLIVFWFLQLDNIFRTGLKGIRMLLFEGVSDSGTFVNTPKD